MSLNAPPFPDATKRRFTRLVDCTMELPTRRVLSLAPTLVVATQCRCARSAHGRDGSACPATRLAEAHCAVYSDGEQEALQGGPGFTTETALPPKLHAQGPSAFAVLFCRAGEPARHTRSAISSQILAPCGKP